MRIVIIREGEVLRGNYLCCVLLVGVIMKVYYVIRNFGGGGGCKVMLQHVRFLHNAGIDATLFILKRLETKDPIESNLISLNPEHIEQADILVTTLPKDVRNFYRIYKKKGPILCHLCQGYEPIDLMARITKESIPEKYAKKPGLLGNISYALETIKFKRRIRRIERIYAYDTKKIAVSRHLRDLIERKYNQKCHYVPNGIDGNTFYAKGDIHNYDFQKPIKVLSVGSMDVAFKGIPDTLEGIKILRHQFRMPI
jgi:glycosyltransferase involved in cell wall biosynthesis